MSPVQLPNMATRASLLVVFVDPDFGVRAEAERQLRAAGYTATSAVDVGDAFTKLDTHAGPIVIMMHTPDSEGDCETARDLVEDRPDLFPRTRVATVAQGPRLVGQQVPLETVVKYLNSMQFETLIGG